MDGKACLADTTWPSEGEQASIGAEQERLHMGEIVFSPNQRRERSGQRCGRCHLASASVGQTPTVRNLTTRPSLDYVPWQRATTERHRTGRHRGACAI